MERLKQNDTKTSKLANSVLGLITEECFGFGFGMILSIFKAKYIESRTTCTKNGRSVLFLDLLIIVFPNCS